MRFFQIFGWNRHKTAIEKNWKIIFLLDLAEYLWQIIFYVYYYQYSLQPDIRIQHQRFCLVVAQLYGLAERAGALFVRLTLFSQKSF